MLLFPQVYDAFFQFKVLVVLWSVYYTFKEFILMEAVTDEPFQIQAIMALAYHRD
ncbi:unnamed protein product [Mycena citricolor]|uniref:Uncharacterized protein n=1 Tax=Mycena citricolor TaxID=2018698 RepID=A0AAD2JXB6_9AGAR|nr:unnamed protein product [Mycena citricolor]